MKCPNCGQVMQHVSVPADLYVPGRLLQVVPAELCGGCGTLQIGDLGRARCLCDGGPAPHKHLGIELAFVRFVQAQNRQTWSSRLAS